MLAVPFAHRGLHYAQAPENSLFAFDRAAAAGLGIELDIQLSIDGVAIVHHDRTLHRMTGLDARVADLRGSALRRVFLAGTRETIPTLADALHVIDERVPVLVDLKSSIRAPGRRRLVEAVASVLDTYRGPAGIVSFDPLVLSALGPRLPHVAIGQTGGVDPVAFDQRRWLRPACRPVDALWSRRVSRPHFVAFNVSRMPSHVVARVRRSLPVVAWTVRTADEYALARDHADGVIVEDAAVGLALERSWRQRPPRRSLTA